MRTPRIRILAATIAAIYPVFGMATESPTDISAAVPESTPLPMLPTPPAAPTPPTTSQSPTKPTDPEKLEVVGKRLDDARNGLSPDVGSTVFRFDKKDITNLPLGDSTPLNQVILRAPGVSQDSFGQVHLRGDHANLQYRVNGVVIPESISGFGQALDTRFADQINILTGALPAQYGYRTAGIVDIQSKGGAFENGGKISLLGGSRQHREVGGEISGTLGEKNAFTYYLTGAYTQNNLGIENPTPQRNAIHDHTTQNKSFGYLSYLLDNDSRLSLIFGTSNNKFQIPNSPGKIPNFILNGAPTITSESLDARQSEKNRFQVLSYQGSPGGRMDYQLSAFHRNTNVHYQPDSRGDLVFNGIAAEILRDNEAAGLQADLSVRVGDKHTVRAGLFLQRERFSTDNRSSVFAADGAGNQTGTTPFTIIDNNSNTGNLYGLYLQDEWKPGGNLTVNYGARVDKANTVVSEQQFSPRLGLVYDLSKQTRLHIGYARYFTPPPTEKIDTTSVARFANTTNALPSNANTAIKSERSNYFDLGLTHELTPHISLGLDAYYRNIRHLQDEGQFGKALIFSAFNYAKGKVRGVELSGTYHDKTVTAYANLAWSKAEAREIETGQFNFDDTELAYINNHWVHLDHDQTITAAAGATYRWDASTNLSVDAIYGSGLRRGFANTEHLPVYTQWNTAVTKTFNVGSIGKFDARLAIVNLFDKSYQLRDGSGIGVGAPQFAPRRTFYVGLSKPF